MKRLPPVLVLSLTAVLCGAATLNACLPPTRAACVQLGELTPDVAKQALLEMMRSKPGQALGFFDKKLVDEMAKAPVEKKKDEYHWTGAYRFDTQKVTYNLFVSLGDNRPPLRPHPKGYVLFVGVYEGSFAKKDGRWTATVPKYKYALLD